MFLIGSDLPSQKHQHFSWLVLLHDGMGELHLRVSPTHDMTTNRFIAKIGNVTDDHSNVDKFWQIIECIGCDDRPVFTMGEDNNCVAVVVNFKSLMERKSGSSILKKYHFRYISFKIIRGLVVCLQQPLKQSGPILDGQKHHFIGPATITERTLQCFS